MNKVNQILKRFYENLSSSEYDCIVKFPYELKEDPEFKNYVNDFGELYHYTKKASVIKILEDKKYKIDNTVKDSKTISFTVDSSFVRSKGGSQGDDARLVFDFDTIAKNFKSKDHFYRHYDTDELKKQYLYNVEYRGTSRNFNDKYFLNFLKRIDLFENRGGKLKHGDLDKIYSNLPKHLTKNDVKII